MATKLAEIRAMLEAKAALNPDPIPTQAQADIMWKLARPKIDPLVHISEFTGSTCDCPACGNPHLHQIGVEIFDRQEDSETGNHIYMPLIHNHMCDTIDPSIDSDMSQNPSPRRTGTLIHFMCEECHGLPKLAIQQHQGQTFFHWQL